MNRKYTNLTTTILLMNPPLHPSQEGNLQAKLPSSEGLGVGSWPVRSSFWTRRLLMLLAISSISGPLRGRAEDPPAWINANPKITFKSLAPVAVKLVSAPQGNEFSNFVLGPDSGNPNYKLAPEGLKQGAKPYTDRPYPILKLPEMLNGLTLLQTKMGHKGVGEPSYAVVLAVEKPAYLFLAIDDRMIRLWVEEGIPEWVKEFSPTGYRIITDDPAMSEERPYTVVARKVSAGEIKLGPPRSKPDKNPYRSMYFAFVGSGEPDAAAPKP